MLRAFLAIGAAALMLELAASPIVAQQKGVIKPVKGIVVDEAGAPVAGASVTISWNRLKENQATTDASGAFEIRNRFSPTGQMIVAKTADGAKQGLLEVPHDAHEWKDDSVAKVVLRPAVSVIAKVIDAKGAPVAGAKAGVSVRFFRYREMNAFTETSTTGEATWFIPAGAEGITFLALKDDVGMDYAIFGERRLSTAEPFALPKEPPVLRLDGVEPLVVTVLDEDQIPLPNVRVHASLLSKNSPIQTSIGSANLSYFGDAMTISTDAEGRAFFRWIPSTARHLSCSIIQEGYANGRLNIDFQQLSRTTNVTLQKFVPISGKVITASGEPAKNAVVQLSGRGYENRDGAAESLETDQNGAFTIQVAPNLLCMVGARQGNQVSRPVEGLVTERGKPISGIVLKLEPGIRIFGKLTQGPNKVPQPGKSVMLTWQGKDIRQFPGLALPNPGGLGWSVAPQLSQNGKTNDAGEYEFFTCAGQNVIRPQGAGLTGFEKVELSKELEKEVSFHKATADTAPLSGKVVSAEGGLGVQGAIVTLAYESLEGNFQGQAITNSEGRFQMDRSPTAAKAFAISPDGKLADLKSVSGTDATADFSLRPTASLRGRVIDSATGMPIIDKEITYGVEIEISGRDGGTLYSTRFGKRIRTDKDGKFETGPIATNVESEVSLQLDQTGRTYTLVKITPTKAGTMDLGDVRLEREE